MTSNQEIKMSRLENKVPLSKLVAHVLQKQHRIRVRVFTLYKCWWFLLRCFPLTGRGEAAGHGTLPPVPGGDYDH